MKTVINSLHPLCSNPASSQGNTSAKVELESLFYLFAGTVITFALATLTLFGLNAGVSVVTTRTWTPMPLEQRHAVLPAFTDKLAVACWQGLNVTLLDSPNAGCAILVAQAAQHLSGTNVPAGMMDCFARRLTTMVSGKLQTGTYRIATNWLD